MRFDYIIATLSLLGALLAIVLPPQLLYAVILVVIFNIIIHVYSRFKLKTRSIMPLFKGTAENVDAPRLLMITSIALFGSLALAYLTRSYLGI